MSAEYDITSSALISANFRPIHAGDDYIHKFTVERPADTPLDLTGAQLWFSIKQGAKESDGQAQLHYDSDLTSKLSITDGANGEFEIRFAAADTANLVGLWSYDIKAKLSSSNIIRLARGIIEFLPNLTKAS